MTIPTLRRSCIRTAEHWAHLANWGAVDRNGIDIVVSLRRNQRAIEELARLALDHGLYRSSALSSLTLRRLHALRNECVRDFDRYASLLGESSQRLVTRGPAFEGDLTTAVSSCVRS